MKTQRFACGLTGLMSLCLALGLMLSLAEAQERISSEVKVAAGRQLTNKEKQALSVAAGRILIHVNHARNHIRHKQGKEALRQVEKALTLAKIIETTVPEYRIMSTIRGGNLYVPGQRNGKIVGGSRVSGT